MRICVYREFVVLELVKLKRSIYTTSAHAVRTRTVKLVHTGEGTCSGCMMHAAGAMAGQAKARHPSIQVVGCRRVKYLRAAREEHSQEEDQTIRQRNRDRVAVGDLIARSALCPPCKCNLRRFFFVF